MNRSVLKIIGVLVIFLAGIGMGASGLWLAFQNYDELRYLLIEQPTVNSPQAKIANFMKSITKGDKSTALKLWEIPNTTFSEQQNALQIRRERVISDLVSANINPEYMLLGIEWWTTCCEPNVTNNPQNAGGARINVQFLDKNGLPVPYTFDVFTRDQPYWGSAEGYPPRDWVIRDVYPDNKEPLYWPLIYEPHIQFIQTAEP